MSNLVLSVKFIVVVLVLSLTYEAYSQGEINQHVVLKGETINQIALRFKVTPNEIYKLNPDALNGLKFDMVLLIPKNTIASSSKVETSKIKLNTSKNALKMSVSPVVSKVSTLKVVCEKNMFHIVLPKETKYSIAKQYGVSISELEKNNPEIVCNLTVGYNLLIKKQKSQENNSLVGKVPTKEIASPLVANAFISSNYGSYVVKSKETLYSLCKMFEIDQKEFLKLNPALQNGVIEGMVLKVPLKTSIPFTSKKSNITLLKKASEDSKKMVLLMPFNISKIEGDTLNSTVSRLKKDKFLNMTLDFYSGALMAIDSVKQMGFPIEVEIYDSQETKNSSNVPTIIQENKLETVDAIIGPFYQKNIEETAELVSLNSVPVLSPLSKDLGKSYPNLYQTIVSSTILKNSMFDFMHEKQGNIIAVVDKKKESIIQYLQENQKEVRFAPLTANGSLSVENLKRLLIADKMNYVVMETGNTLMIRSVLASMLKLMATYKLQLVILEPNETLDTDEIDFSSLVKLKLMYPSMTRFNSSTEALLFEKNYKKKNKVAPSDFAIRGFDITFDTMLRLSQGKKYEETAVDIVTEQLNNKFEYFKNENGGYVNKGAYVLYYDSDLTIKEAK
jgi:LysM repeat protein